MGPNYGHSQSIANVEACLLSAIFYNLCTFRHNDQSLSSIRCSTGHDRVRIKPRNNFPTVLSEVEND